MNKRTVDNFVMAEFVTALSVLASVALFLLFAIPRKKGLSVYGKRFPERVVYGRIEKLSYKCKAVRRGNGIGISTVKFGSAINKLLKNTDGSEHRWKEALINGKDVFRAAAKASRLTAFNSYMLPAVNGYPRLYLFCNELVKSRQGDVSEKVLSRAFDVFCKALDITRAEVKELYAMTAFCLTELVSYVCTLALTGEKSFIRGQNDGKNGLIDLDSLFDPNYISGFYDNAGVDDKRYCDSLLVTNGSSAETLLTEHKSVLANYAATLCAVRRSLDRSEYSYKSGRKEYSRTSVCVCTAAAFVTVLPTVLFLLYAPTYSAVLYVVAIAFYGVFRIFLPKLASELIFFDPFSAIKNKPAAMNDGLCNVCGKDDALFFGGEAEYVCERSTGVFSNINADNRGKVVSLRNGLSVPDRLDFFIHNNSGTVRLAMCDGAFFGNRTVYRKSFCDTELSVEFVPLPDACGSYMNAEIINRTGKAQTMQVYAAFLPMAYSTDNVYGIRRIQNGAALCDGDKYNRALFLDGGRYGTNYNVAEGCVLSQKPSGAPAIVGERAVTVAPFSVEKITGIFAYGNGLRELCMLGETDDGYYLYATDFARYFGEKRDHRDSAVPEQMIRPANAATLPSAALPFPVYKIEDSIGGFTDNGSYIVDGMLRDGRAIDNVLGRYVRITASADRIKQIDFNGDIFSSSDELVCSAVSDGNALLIPFGRNRRGIIRTEHGIGYSKFVTSYNGIVCSIICYALGDRAVFLYKLENNASISREITVMFSLNCGSEGCYTGKGIAFSHCGKQYFLSCSEKAVDHCFYKEGFYIYGEIARASGFRKGGTTPAQTVSATLNIPPLSSGEVVFTLCERNAKPALSMPNVKQISREYSGIIDLKVRPASDVFYKHAIFSVKNARTEELLPADAAIVVCAKKYCDINSYRNDVLRLLAQQKEDGSIGGAELPVALAAVDYVEFTGEIGFLRHTVKFKSTGSRRIYGTVSEHIIRAAYIAAEERESLRPDYGLCKDIGIIKLFEFAERFGLRAGERSKRIQIIYDCINRKAKSLDALKNLPLPSKSDIFGSLIRAAAESYCDPNKAYTVLQDIIPINRNNSVKDGIYIEPYAFFKMGAGQIDAEKNAVCCALFYLIITENILGIKINNGKISLAPSVPKKFCADISVNYGGESADISIDGRGTGEWRPKKNGITYGSNVCFKLKSGDKIEYSRSGNEQ